MTLGGLNFTIVPPEIKMNFLCTNFAYKYVNFLVRSIPFWYKILLEFRIVLCRFLAFCSNTCQCFTTFLTIFTFYLRLLSFMRKFSFLSNRQKVTIKHTIIVIMPIRHNSTSPVSRTQPIDKFNQIERVYLSQFEINITTDIYYYIAGPKYWPRRQKRLSIWSMETGDMGSQGGHKLRRKSFCRKVNLLCSTQVKPSHKNFLYSTDHKIG